MDSFKYGCNQLLHVDSHRSGHYLICFRTIGHVNMRTTIVLVCVAYSLIIINNNDTFSNHSTYEQSSQSF